jgi:hypothetical protein
VTEYARAFCPDCKREVAVYVPAGGDGSGFIYRKHDMEPGSGRYCEGWAKPVEQENVRP